MTFFRRPKKPTPNDHQLTEQRLDAATRKVELDKNLYAAQELLLFVREAYRKRLPEAERAAADAEVSSYIKAQEAEWILQPPGISPGPSAQLGTE